MVLDPGSGPDWDVIHVVVSADLHEDTDRLELVFQGGASPVVPADVLNRPPDLPQLNALNVYRSSFRLPAPGEYEVRFVAGSTNITMVTSAVITWGGGPGGPLRLTIDTTGTGGEVIRDPDQGPLANLAVVVSGGGLVPLDTVVLESYDSTTAPISIYLNGSTTTPPSAVTTPASFSMAPPPVGRYRSYLHTPAGIATFGPDVWVQFPSSSGSTETYYYDLDGIGSVRQVANASQTWRKDFQPFGLETGGNVSTGGRADDIGFAGKEIDSTGLNYFGARYYSAYSGRFTSADPVIDVENAIPDPQRWNRYSYVRNAPFRFTDPDGRMAVEDDPDEKAAAGAGVARAAGATLASDGAARANYAKQASELGGPGGSAARSALRQETYDQLTPFGRALTDYLRQSRTGQLQGKTAAQLAESASRTSSGVNAIGGAARGVGGGLLVVGAGVSAYNIATAPAGQRARAAAGEGGAWSGALAGGVAGGKGGAFVGSLLEPGLGTAIGAGVGTLGGGALGALAGTRAGTAIYDWLFP